ncbi:MAG: hypothetical protein E6Q97_33500 [Desulfurellales bacterium]|nr:MAG: hypothetical protein E6Q97_33500 [Desulfurellales bacterium]
MPELQIQRCYDRKVLYSGEAESMLELVLRAHKEKAVLSGAVLRGAVLSGAEINWTSHDLVSEILRREAGDSISRQMFAGFIVLRRDLCWDSFLSIHDDAFAAHKEWALTSLRKWVREGDNAPTVLRNTPLAESA